MNKVQARRLLKLADFLTALPKQKFDFAVVAHEYGKPMIEALKAGKTRCGTTACAIGWMPAVFPRQLMWLRGNPLGEERSLHVDFKVNGKGKYSSFEVAESFFGIDGVESRYLFNPRDEDGGRETSLPYDATAKQVARRIRAFVKRKTKVAA